MSANRFKRFERLEQLERFERSIRQTPGSLTQADRRFNPDSAVEREVMSKEQTFRSEDNAFCL